MKILKLHKTVGYITITLFKNNPQYGGRCDTCGRYDNDGGPLCNNVFCPGGN
ncbi:hypothetical protein [Yersinia phage fHe-Yen9-04]|uniref:Uncharacterized protein n=1 Tax=Yersinia phage fHe-Yen9-04 TaxID=2052742 RepID=A0A2C9CXL5_9CAUD|nr:hypothetical protein FDJ41_gp521 [Yersinia phage fHe-Yen9-04]SOK58659.1 hypothetical protein [Yersinia phage fHe-Yen9-04]VUE36428.1 hypothetical protein [Yersinia phage fHe-Yen9-04]